jgi:hypothetical protein
MGQQILKLLNSNTTQIKKIDTKRASIFLINYLNRVLHIHVHIHVFAIAIAISISFLLEVVEAVSE